MKQIRFISIALIGALALLSTACEKEISSNDELYRPIGTKIPFTVSTGYENGVVTKAEYSGELFGTSNKIERIDWVKDDPIKIVYNNTAASYKVVEGVTANNEKSTAKIDGNLVWQAGPHKFYALYPAGGTNSAGSLSNAGKVEGSIPASQPTASSTVAVYGGVQKFQPNTAQYGYLVAYKEIDSSSGLTSVELPFVPAVTTFEFKLKRKDTDTDLKLTKAVLSSQSGTTGADMTGKFSFTITGGNDRGATWGTVECSSVGRSIEVSFPTGGVSIPTDGYLDFSILALPIDQKALTLTLTYADETSKKINLKDNMGDTNPDNDTWHTFTGAKKYIITNDYVPGGAEVWTYYVDDIADISTYGHVATSDLGFTVKSYRKSNLGTIEPIHWKVQYSTSKNGPWSDTQPAAWTPSFGAMFSLTKTYGDGSLPSVGEANAANIARDHDVSEKEESGFDSEQAAIAVLQGRGLFPTDGSAAADGYYDLSKHPIYGDGIDGPETERETANCYVITRPGKYKFPLVYGNAIYSNSDNVDAYAPQGKDKANDNNYFLRRFVRHDDKPIVDPWLKNNGVTVADAVVVWQDVTNADMQILLDDDIDVDQDFVYFEIKSERIRPGNILLAARDANGTIVWSWHIWVTEKDLTPHRMKDKTGKEHFMMEYNLGWTDKVSAHGWHWNDWPFYVRVIQTDASGNILNSTNPQNVDATGAADVFAVTQFGESISVDANIGSNCFYQWGRKDPILPAASNNKNKRVYSAKYSLADIVEGDHEVVTKRNDSGTFGQSIKTPYNVFYSRNNTGLYSSADPRGNASYVGIAINNDGTSLGKAANYGNLWDSGLIARKADYDAAHGAGTGNAISINNRLPVKTVYDPSPRGYVVPYAFAFTGFSSSDYNVNWLQNVNEPHPAAGSQLVSDGIKFPDGYGGLIYIPYAGSRAGNGGAATNPSLYDVTATMYYWTTGKDPVDGSTYNKSKTFTVLKDTNPDVRAIWDQYGEGAYAIRPVLEMKPW